MPPVSLRASTAEKVRVSTQRPASDPRRLQRLARLGGDRQREVVEPLAGQLGGAVEDGGALVLGEVARLEGGAGGDRAAVDQRRVAQRDPADDGPVVGALDLAPLTGLDPLARGEELVVDCLDGLRRHPAKRRGGRGSPRRMPMSASRTSVWEGLPLEPLSQ